jgi:hypothetical protein
VSESPADPTPGAEPSAASAAQLVEELRRAKVSDLLLHTSSMLASIAFGKLAPDLRDFEQARLAIDALDALVPLLEEGEQRDIQQVISNLKLAYADAAASEAPAEQ